MPLIQIETTIHQDIEIVFDLSRSIDLHSDSTSKTNERAIAGCTKGLINLGETVTWEATHFGVRQRLTSIISEMERPYFFVDEMQKGIFKKIYHLHTFEKSSNFTIMKDEFYFESPLSIFGMLANEIFLKKYLTDFLTVRNQYIKDIAESERWENYLKKE